MNKVIFIFFVIALVVSSCRSTRMRKNDFYHSEQYTKTIKDSKRFKLVNQDALQVAKDLKKSFKEYLDHCDLSCQKDKPLAQVAKKVVSTPTDSFVKTITTCETKKDSTQVNTASKRPQKAQVTAQKAPQSATNKKGARNKQC